MVRNGSRPRVPSKSQERRKARARAKGSNPKAMMAIKLNVVVEMPRPHQIEEVGKSEAESVVANVAETVDVIMKMTRVATAVAKKATQKATQKAIQKAVIILRKLTTTTTTTMSITATLGMIRPTMAGHLMVGIPSGPADGTQAVGTTHGMAGGVSSSRLEDASFSCAVG